MPDQMPTVGMERKLAAIFSTDVAGYSRLMGDDEAATIRTLTAYREVMTTLIQRHRGRVVDSPGDNLLAEFADPKFSIFFCEAPGKVNQIAGSDERNEARNVTIHYRRWGVGQRDLQSFQAIINCWH